MESSLDSWQHGSLSSAESITFSPPISPAPPSPTLYTHNLSYNNFDKSNLLDSSSITLSPLQNDPIEIFTLDAFNETEQLLDTPESVFINGNGEKSLLTNALDMAAISFPSKLDTVPPGPSGNMSLTGQFNPSFSPNEMDDIYECEGEEKSYNLEGFDDILEDRWVLLDDECQPQSPYRKRQEINIMSSIPLIHNVGTSIITAEDIRQNKLIDSFQEIIDELGLAVDVNSIENIPGTSLIYADELNELANEGEDLGLISGDDSMMDADDDQSDRSSSVGNASPHIGFNEVVIVSDEHKPHLSLYHMEDSIMSNASNVVLISNSSSASDSDDEDDAQEMILDALLRGDLEAAAAAGNIFKPSVSSRQQRTSRSTKTARLDNETPQKSALVSKKLAMMKPEKRGRKPSSAAAGKAWVHLTDKGMRKKEQNKTAATRYRQKKKMETIYSLEKEQELQGENEQLIKEKDELGKQIKMMKELLRDLFLAKSKRCQSLVRSRR